MGLKKIVGSLLTPILGIAPTMAFLIGVSLVPFHIALIIALLTYPVFFIVNTWLLKYAPPYSIYVSIYVFLLLIIFSFLKPFELLYIEKPFLLFEVFLIFIFSLFRLFKNYYREKILIKNEETRDLQLIRFDTDVFVMKIIAYLAIIHLIVVLVYSSLPVKYHSDRMDKTIYFVLLYAFIALFFFYELFHVFFLKKKYIAEKWLPVVDETGTVHGKVAQSISLSSGNKYLHPVVRIALIHKGMLFLKERLLFNSNNIKELDYPFESYLQYRETLEEGVMRTFEENGGIRNLPLQYLFRYVFKNIKTNRLIYLYVCNIQDINTVNFRPGKGKWWTRKQIEENLGKGFFSDYFEKEYELLSGVILKADRLMWDMPNN